MVCGFQLAMWAGVSIRLVVKEAIGEGAAKLLVEQDEGEGHFGALAGEAVSIAFAIPGKQAMRLHFAEIVAELVQPIA